LTVHNEKWRAEIIQDQVAKPVEYSKSSQASVLLFKQAFAHASVGLALVALDGHFIYTNSAYENLTGYTTEELKHLTIGSLMYPEDAKSNAVLRTQMLEGKIPGYVIEKRYKRKDGSFKWVKSSISLGNNRGGKPAYIVGVTEDIDERHKAVEALKESEARFRFMAEYMPPKVFTANSNGELDYFSPQWRNYTGLSNNDMDLTGWSHVIHPNDRDENLRRWQYCIRTGSHLYVESRLRRSDGEYRWHLTTAHAMRDEQGKVIMWIGSSTDIQELRQSRGLKARLQILAKQREQLLATNRSKDEFIMLASHQLRTPASGVKQFVGMVIQGYVGKVPKKQFEILKRAYDCNERQLKITDDLLRVARIDTGQVSLTKIPYNSVELIRNVIAEGESTFSSRKQKVHFKPLREKIPLVVDTKLIYMVLENLLDNASKYSPEGTTIRVGVRTGKDSISISVKDRGVGIAPEDKDKLFQKFSRISNPLSDTVGGSGLGLYLAKKILELHRGTLTVHSTLGEGSTFTIRLPIHN
jgi:PAS domain S-box-containing protein